MDDLEHLFPSRETRETEDMREIRDRLIAWIEEHEAVHHAGRMCQRERANAIAFLCHAIGLGGPAFVGQLGELIADYDRHCARNAGRGPGE